MGTKIKHKASQLVRLRMRTVLITCSIIGSVLTGITLFTFHLFENESSVAGTNPMVISNIEVFQDTMPVLKGTTMQLVLGINIQTKGASQHLNFSGLELSARGTSNPVASLVNNARLWSTGNTDFFVPVRQLGATISGITEENFRLDSKQKLLEGDNYFWITFDISHLPGSRTNYIDAECLSVQIGTLDHEPGRSAPPGSKKVINNIPFYSARNGDISSLDSWNSSRDGSGRRPSNFNQFNATFHIQPGHILRNDLNACISYLLVERNGVLQSGSGIKSEHVEVHGGGTFIQSKAFSTAGNIENFVIRNGGSYIHRNKGSIPGNIKQFDDFSNVILNDYSPLTFSMQVDWGNLVIDGNTSVSTEFSNCLRTIKGNLEIRSTGKGQFLFSTTADTISVGGNLVINGGWLALVPVRKKMLLTVNKEFTVKSGMFSDFVPGKPLKGSVELYPGTKMYLKSGTFKMAGKNSFISFQEEFVNWIQDTANVVLPDIVIMPGCTLKLEGNHMGSIDAGRNLIVSSTGMLDCGTSTITGKGTFKLEPHGILATGHPHGIFSEVDSGSIRTQSRFFSSSGEYMFTGNCSPQVTGIFNTQPATNTVNQITINKTSVNGVVILQQDLKITGRLVKARGSINKNSHKLDTGDQTTATITP